ncbi:hypothetical protein [Sinorhizobium prairiense]|uniref:hypothetical protein n=1 Tax=unclassified Sinorhizobium TaxID=2613772 RepID=UPI0023D7B944|nr:MULTISPECIES: hypothetical protein [unclassified Sinorhizobium]WEJ11758.1 hypothetical protein N0Q90_21775 [Sinorhizobium sp. M103]WEJ17619.1 hypothetical protein N0Q91_20650 [Sinorhizobium sp. K101]WEJ40427.1 hypothetical protein N0R80_31265 [Sinorhizobium sp. C101]
MQSMRKVLEPSMALAAKLNAIQPLAIDHARLASIGAIMPSIEPKVISAIQGVQPLKIDPSLASAVSQMQRALEQAMAPLGGIGSAIKQFEQQHRAVQKSLLASLAGPVGDIAKTSQWASTLGRIDTPDITKLLGGGLGTAIDDMRGAIAKNFRLGRARSGQDQLQPSAGSSISNRNTGRDTQVQSSRFEARHSTVGHHCPAVCAPREDSSASSTSTRNSNRGLMHVVSQGSVKGVKSFSAIQPIPQTMPEWQLYAAIYVA